jgi:hypothetical protein
MSNEKDEQIELTSETFVNVLRHQKQLLLNAVALRKKIQAALDRGETPDHYRVDFIRTSALRVNNCLADCAKDFNEAHQDDRCTAADLIDILNTVINMFYSKIKKG